MKPGVWMVLLIGLPAIGAVDSGDDSGWITSAGGTVSRNAAGQVTAINFRASWVTDADLRGLAKFPALTALDLSLTRVTDQAGWSRDNARRQLKGALKEGRGGARERKPELLR